MNRVAMSERVALLRERLPSRREINSALETGLENIRESRIGRSAIRVGRRHPYVAAASVLGFIISAWALANFFSSEDEY
jgi:hypothetical protein